MSTKMNKLNRFLESTLLRPTMTSQDVEALIKDAIEEQFIGVCIPSFWVKKTKRELLDYDIQVVTVIGFPFGFQDTASKIAEMRESIRQGADELDLVWSQTAFHSGMNWPKIEISEIAKICHEEERLLKVIIETAFLSRDQIREACLICEDAGADFVKTSTGYAPSGAKAEDIIWMREVLSSQIGIKASGGIKTLDHTLELIKAGADRIGTSSAKFLMDSLKLQGD